MINIKVLSNREARAIFFEKIKFVLVSIFFAYLSVIFIRLTLELIASYFNLNLQIDKLNTKKRPLLKIFISIILIAPIIEELIFRVHLKLKRKFFIISIVLLSCLLISEVYKTKSFNFNSIFYIIYILYLFLVMFINIKYSIEDSVYLRKTNIIINCLFFALFHITNYKITNNNNVYLLIINVLPMFIFGYYFSIIRLKLNIYWAILAHMTANFLPFIILIIKKQKQTSNIYNTSYSIDYNN